MLVQGWPSMLGRGRGEGLPISFQTVPGAFMSGKAGT